MAACTLYNLCFFVYVWLTPVFLQFLIRAPSNYDPAPFYPVPMRTLSGDVPELYMSSFPQTTRSGVNHCRPCSERYGQRSGMYQWDIMLSMSEKDLIKESKDKPVSTMYPLVFASNDAKTWKVVADADDVAGKGHWAGKSNEADEATHLSAPLLVANLKNFGCVDDETAETDPFFHHFASKAKALNYKWRLVKHIAMHGSVNLVACVMQGMDDMNQLIHTYARDCIEQGEMKCHLTTRQALAKCFAIGSACGQACGFFSPNSPECKGGTLDPVLFTGLTHRKVKIKTSPGGGGAAEALVYCSKKPCDSGLHFNNMYVEAENPIEFLKAQMDIKNKEKGSYYVLMFAMSDFHAPMHTFEVVSDEDDDDEGEDGGEGEDEDEEARHQVHHTHHLHHTHKEPGKPDHEGTHEPVKKPKKKKKAKRTCVDLPGVRLGEIDKSNLDEFIDEEGTNSALGCTAWCGKHPTCQQSVFASANNGCYLFKIPTVEVRDYSPDYNSSYCGHADAKDMMMTMLHQAYKNYVPPAPKPVAPPPPAAPWAPPPAQPLRRLQVMPPMQGMEVDPEKKYYWQIAHVPNGTSGVLTDQGANEVRVVPRNTSCFTTPGFVYMVACMTAKPVYVSDRTHPLRPPPFNDRCLAVGGLCGATCGSGQQVTENVAKYCPLATGTTAMRRLQGSSPYASASIPKDMLVQKIDPQRNSNQQSYAARIFFNMFIFIAVISYFSTVLSKFPGNFRDRHPIHTWDEIRTHGYLLEKFGSAVTCSTSTAEDKTVVLRSWVGKSTTRPQFDDTAFPTFSKWVDVFCDEGHREGARLLWMAWTDFLDTSPPVEFLQEWSSALRDMSLAQLGTSSPFDLKWDKKKVLPVVPSQSRAFWSGSVYGEDATPQGGVTLQPDSLAKLRDLAEVFRSLPNDLRLEAALPCSDDVVLTRRVLMDFQVGSKASTCFSIQYSNGWLKELEKKTDQRARELNFSARDKYEKSLITTDKNGKKISAFGPGFSSLKEAQFPLHFREPPSRKDRMVIMVYCARAKPEVERKGIEPTRGVDKYLWASLRPKAVRKAGLDGGVRRVFNNKKKQSAEEEKPLLNDSNSERSWSSVQNGECPIFDEVKRCVEGMVERQHREFLDRNEDGDEPPATSRSQAPAEVEGALQRELTRAYLRHRTVDSDWEMARFCYGEVVGVERGTDGEEIVILDNPSPALLDFVVNPPSQGAPSSMGLVTLHDEGETKDWFGKTHKVRTANATKPSLTFKFMNSNPSSPDAANFQKELLRKINQLVAEPTLDVNKLVVQEQRKGNELVVDLVGPGKIIEVIRARNIRDIQVLNYRGRMMDTHPCIAIKKDLLMPYAGVRGRSGGLNFVVDLLQFREGFIGTAADGDPTPERMLMSVFDSQQQPHPDFWKRCLPKFMMNTDAGYTYKVNDDITLVQAPESGPSDTDSLMGVSWSIINMIRNKCGGVTACGTNEVWQINARQFSRQEDEALSNEYFHSRTLIPGTATTHAHFCKGQRSVYVQEKVATGMAKSNSEGLAGIQMRAEGAVQLFWVELFSERPTVLLRYAAAMLLLFGLMWFRLFGPTSKDLIGYNLFCDSDAPALLLGADSPMCTKICDLFGSVLGRNGDKVRFQMAEHDYMELIDMAFGWLLVCVAGAVCIGLMALRGTMPSIVRVFIMLENITYWMTSWNIFFWLALVLFMVIGMDPPLMFNGSHFMFFALLINFTQHTMLNEYKSMSDCTEIAIWRNQQSYTLAAPLYLGAVVQGTISAWHIIMGRRDASYWSSTTVAEVVTCVTVWVTFIWVAFVGCLIVIAAINVAQLVLGRTPEQMQGEEHFSAAFLIGLIAVTVWEPFLSLWGTDKTVEALSKNEKSGQARKRLLASFAVWWRSKAWILRYIMDFVIPLLVLCGVLQGSHTLIVLVAYASTAHGLRM